MRPVTEVARIRCPGRRSVTTPMLVLGVPPPDAPEFYLAWREQFALPPAEPGTLPTQEDLFMTWAANAISFDQWMEALNRHFPLDANHRPVEGQTWT